MPAATFTNFSFTQPHCGVQSAAVSCDMKHESQLPDGRMPSTPFIGENCILSGTIVDKNAVIGKGVQFINKQKLSHYDGDGIFIREGIIIVPRGQ